MCCSFSLHSQCVWQWQCFRNRLPGHGSPVGRRKGQGGVTGAQLATNQTGSRKPQKYLRKAGEGNEGSQRQLWGTVSGLKQLVPFSFKQFNEKKVIRYHYFNVQVLPLKKCWACQVFCNRKQNSWYSMTCSTVVCLAIITYLYQLSFLPYGWWPLWIYL